jgi:hypothetical protein
MASVAVAQNKIDAAIGALNSLPKPNAAHPQQAVVRWPDCNLYIATRKAQLLKQAGRAIEAQRAILDGWRSHAAAERLIQLDYCSQALEILPNSSERDRFSILQLQKRAQEFKRGTLNQFSQDLEWTTFANNTDQSTRCRAEMIRELKLR